MYEAHFPKDQIKIDCDWMNMEINFILLLYTCTAKAWSSVSIANNNNNERNVDELKKKLPSINHNCANDEW